MHRKRLEDEWVALAMCLAESCPPMRKVHRKMWIDTNKNVAQTPYGGQNGSPHLLRLLWRRCPACLIVGTTRAEAVGRGPVFVSMRNVAERRKTV